MFDYTNEVIINDPANQVFKTTDPAGFGIKRGGNYELAKIVDGKVFKTPGVEGKVGSFTIDVSKLTGGDRYQFTMFIGSLEKFVEYALPTWQEFGRPVLVETAGTDADTVASAFKLAHPLDNPVYTVSVDGTNVKITFAKTWMVPKELDVYSVKDVAGEDPTVTEITDAVTTVKNTEDFATADWLVENLRFPSYPNLRYAPLYSDETPIRGKVYTEYTFKYAVKHAAPGGLSGVGQVVDSITSCVLYVPSDLASTFETNSGIASTVTLTTKEDGTPDASKASDETDSSLDPNEAKAPAAASTTSTSE